jgi:hypothetical protein
MMHRVEWLKGYLVASLVLLAAAMPVAADQGSNNAKAKPIFASNEFLVGPPRFTLPFYLFNGHIMIDGAVNGRRGKFMFDTGTGFPFLLNNHYLGLAKDQFIARGSAGSG